MSKFPGKRGDLMTSGSRLPSWRERENNKKRERRRRAIAAKIFAGLRLYGNYNLPKHCDNNEVLKALCREAGWSVEPDGTTYRKGCRPLERMDLIGGSTSASSCLSYHQSACASFNPSPASSSFASPSSSSYAANANNIDRSSLIPWLKNLSSGSSSSSKPPHPFIHNGSISAPVTPPLSSPTCRTPRINPETDDPTARLSWVGQYPFLPLSTPQSPGHQTVPVSEWFAGIRIHNGGGGPSQPTSPTFSLVSPNPFGFREGTVSGGGSLMVTPGQSGTCSPAMADVLMTQVIPDEFAFGSSAKGMVKAWEGEIIHEEDTGSDDLELTLGGSRPRVSY
ncbi:hypothetical protein V2J09_007328 [Rumex salicifolius]